VDQIITNGELMTALESILLDAKYRGLLQKDITIKVMIKKLQCLRDRLSIDNPNFAEKFVSLTNEIHNLLWHIKEDFDADFERQKKEDRS